MRILLLSPHPHVRSPLTRVAPLLSEGLIALGCSVDSAPWGHRQEAESIAAKMVERFGDVLVVRRLLARTRYEVLIVKTSHDARTLARDIPLLLVARRRVPCVVLHFHGSSPALLLDPGRRTFKLATRLLLRLADGTLVLSRDEQEKWTSFAPEKAPVLVKNPFVAPAELLFSRPGRRGTRDQNVNVLFVGRLLEQKGVFDLLQAFAETARQVPARLALVGAGPEAARLERRARELGLADRVELRGYLRGDELAAMYRWADLLALPSWSEGFPTVVAEAMAAGLPIVTTRVGGAMDYLEDGTHALFVPPRRPPELAAALLKLAADPKLRGAMGEANRGRVRIFEPTVVAREYLAVLERMAAASARRSPLARRRLRWHPSAEMPRLERSGEPRPSQRSDGR
jgi:glycosyltransferase involved in cell wall biosynthesis